MSVEKELYDKVQRMQAEIERLRSALQEIADLDPMTADVLTDDVGPLARDIAIRALKDKQ